MNRLDEEIQKILNEEEYVSKDNIKNYVHSSAITNTEHDKFYIKHDFPVKGDVYHLKIDFYYQEMSVIIDNEIFSEDELNIFESRGYIKDHDGEDWLVFPKGTRVIYLGGDMSGGIYDIAGVEVEVSFWDDGTNEVSDEEALM